MFLKEQEAKKKWCLMVREARRQSKHKDILTKQQTNLPQTTFCDVDKLT